MEIVYDFLGIMRKSLQTNLTNHLLSGHVGHSWRLQSGAVTETVFLTHVIPQYLLCVVDILGLALNGWQADQVRFL